MRFRLLLSEAWRSLGANPLDDLRRDGHRARRHVPARPLHRPRHVDALVVEHVKRELIVKVDFKTDATRRAGQRAQETALLNKLNANPNVKDGGVKFVSKEKALDRSRRSASRR